MRDPNRIALVLKEIETYWKQRPDLRLGQILCNMGRNCGLEDPFYLEDDKLLQVLKEYNNPVTHDFKILRVRIVPIVHLHYAFEAEVKIGEECKYFNFAINNEGNLTGFGWAFDKPSDKIITLYSEKEFVYEKKADVFTEMIAIWDYKYAKEGKWFSPEEWKLESKEWEKKN